VETPQPLFLPFSGCFDKYLWHRKVSGMNKQEWAERQQQIATIIKWQPTHAITFNTYQHLSKNDLERLLHAFERETNKIIWGNRSRDPWFRNRWVHYFEREKGNTHSHSFVCLHTEHELKFFQHARFIWRNINNNLTNKRDVAQLWIDTYSDAAAVYGTKNISPIETFA